MSAPVTPHIRDIRRSGLLRQIRIVNGEHVVRFRDAHYRHDNLALLPEGKTVAVVKVSEFAVAVYLQRVPQRRAPAPYCIATRTGGPKPTDADQTALPLP